MLVQYPNMGKNFTTRQCISSEKETEVMGLTPNGEEVNYVCETLNYQYLSNRLWSETTNMFTQYQNMGKTSITCISSAKKTVVIGLSPKAHSVHFLMIFRFSVTYHTILLRSHVKFC